METEFKFSLDDTSVFDSIAADPEISRMCLGPAETIEMHAWYFDTPERDLLANGIVYRIRYEDDRITATIKWDVDVKEGLHRREEFNLVVNDERYAESPDIGLFISSEAYDVLHDAAGDKKLVRLIGMDYTRRQFRIDTGKSISCISVDEGVIHHADGHDVPVHELEIEWYYGDEDDFIALSERIRGEYGLRSENKSKFQRAFE